MFEGFWGVIFFFLGGGGSGCEVGGKGGFFGFCWGLGFGVALGGALVLGGALCIVVWEGLI